MDKYNNNKNFIFFVLRQMAAHYIFVEKGLALSGRILKTITLCMYIFLLYIYNIKKM